MSSSVWVADIVGSCFVLLIADLINIFLFYQSLNLCMNHWISTLKFIHFTHFPFYVVHFDQIPYIWTISFYDYDILDLW